MRARSPVAHELVREIAMALTGEQAPSAFMAVMLEEHTVLATTKQQAATELCCAPLVLLEYVLSVYFVSE